MQGSILLAASIVLGAWIVLFSAIRHWGPGRVRRRVRCPDKHVPAQLTGLYVEPVFGTIQASDVIQCSLFSGAPVACGKQCLHHV